MKKQKFFLIFLTLILFLNFFLIAAQNPLDEFAGRIDEGSRKIEEEGQKVERLTKEGFKWQELRKRWQEILKKNKYVAFIDGIFQKGNIVFVVLFGRDYSLSLTLFFLIILWFYFLSQFNKIFSTFSTFSSSTSFVIALGMTIILAQIKFFDWFSQLIFKFLFYREEEWGWLWTVIIFVCIILIGMFFGAFLSSLRSVVKKMRDENYRKQLLGELEQKNKFFAVIANAFREMFKGNK